MFRKIGMTALTLLGVSASVAFAGDTVPQVTNVVVSDDIGATYNIDSILNLNKVLVIATTHTF